MLNCKVPLLRCVSRDVRWCPYGVCASAKIRECVRVAGLHWTEYRFFRAILKGLVRCCDRNKICRRGIMDNPVACRISYIFRLYRDVCSGFLPPWRSCCVVTDPSRRWCRKPNSKSCVCICCSLPVIRWMAFRSYEKIPEKTTWDYYMREILYGKFCMKKSHRKSGVTFWKKENFIHLLPILCTTTSPSESCGVSRDRFLQFLLGPLW